MKQLLLIIAISTSLAYARETLTVNESITITLASNPTTGYSWRCVCRPKEHINVSHAYTRTQNTTGLMGAGGTETFTLTALKPGNVTCVLEYGRAWDPGSFGDAHTYELIIQD